MKSKRKINVKESGIEVYTDNQFVISVSRELSGDLCFESNNNFVPHFLSYDIAESVAAFMRIKTLKESNSFWSIRIDDRYYEVDAEKCLYWLTGGDIAWRNTEKKYKYSWGECSDLFVNKFSNTIYDIMDEAKTLSDVRNAFRKHLNLNVFYEFSLENDLIK